MLRSLRDLENDSVSAADGDIGKVVNFLLDDRRWVVRYLVVDMNAPVNREHETRLYDYDGRPVYWASDRPELAPRRELSPPRL